MPLPAPPGRSEQYRFGAALFCIFITIVNPAESLRINTVRAPAFPQFACLYPPATPGGHLFAGFVSRWLYNRFAGVLPVYCGHGVGNDPPPQSKAEQGDVWI